MHYLCSSKYLLVVLVQLLLALAPSPANLAPAGEDSALSPPVPEANGPLAVPDTGAPESAVQAAASTPVPAVSNDGSQSASNKPDEICSICLEPNGDKDEDVFVACGHRFHEHCIGRWRSLTQATRRGGRVPCPMCRSNIDDGTADTSDESSAAIEQPTQNGPSVPMGIFTYGAF